MFGKRVFGLLSVFVAVQAAPWPFDLTTLSAPDGSITAKFVSFGATLTELWVKDKAGKARDVILGYDDNEKLLTDPNHPVFIIPPPSTALYNSLVLYNAIVGRYANRIKNGTFSIPITKFAQPPGPGVYQIPTNDHNGEVTLHGGIYGWDRRNWTLEARTPTSVTYKHVDKADEGFPGTVTVFATHTVSNGGILKTSIRATATEKTPIMLTQHIYWNLDAFQNGVNEILNHTLYIDASKVVALDGNAIPTGAFINVQGTPFDFRKPQKLSARWDKTVDLCSQGCQGYDSCWIYNTPLQSKAATSIWSDKSGIKVDISTNQPAVQVYSSFWMNLPRKVIHGGPNVNYTKWSGLAVEQQGYVDAINTPEWGVDQIYGPGRNYEWSTTYTFSTL